jgi:hypothetical protein
MIQIEELTPGGRRAKALSPSPVIDLRNTLAGEARTTRTRQLATPSWLSTRTKPIIERRAPPVCAVAEAVVRQCRQLGARSLRTLGR